MTNLELWSLIAGFLLPPVEAFVQQTRWPNWFRALINFLACCLVSLGLVYWKQPDVTARNWTETLLLTLVTAIATYKGLWTPTRIAPTVERKTNIG